MRKSVTIVPPAIMDIDVHVPPVMYDVTYHGADEYLMPLPRMRQTITMTVKAHVASFFRANLAEEVDVAVNMPTAWFRFRAITKEVLFGNTNWHSTVAHRVTLEAIGPVIMQPLKEKVMARCITTAKTGIEIPKGKDLRDRKFYIGSKQIFPGGNNPDWGHATYEEAEAHAQKMVDETGEDQFIVRIHRVVRKRPTPVDIEKV